MHNLNIKKTFVLSLVVSFICLNIFTGIGGRRRMLDYISEATESVVDIFAENDEEITQRPFQSLPLRFENS